MPFVNVDVDDISNDFFSPLFFFIVFLFRIVSRIFFSLSLSFSSIFLSCSSILFLSNLWLVVLGRMAQINRYSRTKYPDRKNWKKRSKICNWKLHINIDTHTDTLAQPTKHTPNGSLLLIMMTIVIYSYKIYSIEMNENKCQSRLRIRLRIEERFSISEENLGIGLYDSLDVGVYRWVVVLNVGLVF